MTTHHLLILAIHQWHIYWHAGPAIRHHCRVTFLRYLFRLTGNGSYDRWWLRHVFLTQHIGPRAWRGWMQA